MVSNAFLFAKMWQLTNRSSSQMSTSNTNTNKDKELVDKLSKLRIQVNACLLEIDEIQHSLREQNGERECKQTEPQGTSKKRKNTKPEGPFPVGTIVIVTSRSPVRGKPVVVIETRGDPDRSSKVKIGTSGRLLGRDRWFLDRNLRLAEENVAMDFREKNERSAGKYWDGTKRNDEQ